MEMQLIDYKTMEAPRAHRDIKLPRKRKKAMKKALGDMDYWLQRTVNTMMCEETGNFKRWRRFHTYKVVGHNLQKLKNW